MGFSTVESSILPLVARRKSNSWEIIINTIVFENISAAKIDFVQKLERLFEWLIVDQKQEKGWSVSVIFVDDEYIKGLNKKFLGKNRATDVLAFDLSDSFDKGGEGEVYISLETAWRQAEEYDVTFESEVKRLVVHGLLHLFGYKDDTAERRARMKGIEDRALESCF